MSAGMDFDVQGGAGGTDAQFQDLSTLGDASEDLAATLAGISAACHAMLVDPDVLASVVLDPGGFADFEGKLLGALDGSHGLTGLSVTLGTRALALQTVALGYQAADAAQAELMDALHWSAGYLAGTFWPVTLLAAAGLGFAHRDDWQEWLTEHPGMVDWAAGGAPGLAASFGLPVGGLQTAAGLMGSLYADGEGVVTAETTSTDEVMLRPPTGFGDLMDALSFRDDAPTDDRDQIDVRVVTQPDGSRAYIVDIPGTSDWNVMPDPVQENPETSDLGTNLRVLAGQSTAREQAISDALHLAGADSQAPVMLVGHSQGGMVAAQAAADSGTSAFDYNVTHVLTAGSPIARADIPDDVQVLALENEGDVVPHLDAADNPDSANITTVTFDAQHHDVGMNHDPGRSYVPAAEALDGSTDPSVQAYRDSAGAFLTAPGETPTLEAHVFDLERR